MGENRYLAESLCCSPEIVTTLFVNQTYTPIQNKKVFLKIKIIESGLVGYDLNMELNLYRS